MLLNPDKTKFIHIINFNCNIFLNILFLGKPIETVLLDKHLGFPAGNANSKIL